MVEVFKNNIADKITANNVTRDLYKHFPAGRINFDLDDCDRILRIESENVIPEIVANILIGRGFMCEVLE